MTRRLPSVLLTIVAICVFGGMVLVVIDALDQENQKKRFDAIPVSPTTHPAAWHLPQDQRERLVNAVRRLNLGDRKADVLAALGKPDRDQVMVPKGLGLKPLKPHGTMVMYYVVRYEDGLFNEKWDQTIFIEFDMDGRLRHIWSTVAEVPTKGEMIPSPPDPD